MPNATPLLMERLTFPHLLNARDLGGHPTVGGGRTLWKAFLRTDDLVQLTPEGEEALRGYGVRTVVDLRWPEEVRDRPGVFQARGNGVRYHHVSLLLESETRWRESTPVVPKESWNCVILDHAGPQIVRTLRIMAVAPAGTVLFHCAAGKDRTGIVAALLLLLAGAVVESVAEDYARSSEYLRDPYLAARPEVERAVILEEVRCPPEQIHTMLAHLTTTYGGTERYLTRHGLTEREIRALRERLSG